MAQRFADRAPIRANQASQAPHAAPTLVRRPAAATLQEPIAATAAGPSTVAATLVGHVGAAHHVAAAMGAAAVAATAAPAPSAFALPSPAATVMPIGAALAAGTPVTLTSDLGAMQRAVPPRLWRRKFAASILVFGLGGAVVAVALKLAGEPSPTAEVAPPATVQPMTHSSPAPPRQAPQLGSAATPREPDPAAVAVPREGAASLAAAPVISPPSTSTTSVPIGGATPTKGSAHVLHKAAPATPKTTAPSDDDGIGVVHLTH
jgi:hypothetical protein